MKTGAEVINPYNGTEAKGSQVERMFDSIAPAYDFMNTAMSFGLHRHWRARALRWLEAKAGRHGYSDILDVATGTGDVAFDLANRWQSANVTGIDLSDGMLEIANRKRSSLPAQRAKHIAFAKGDCLNLDFADDSFDVVTVFYGVRNFENLRRGYSEIQRVLKPGGVMCVVELSCPRSFLTRKLYDLYAKYIIPTAGRLVSGDRSAYRYLYDSIVAAPQRDDMKRIILEAGFGRCFYDSYTLGTATCYMAEKPKAE